MKDIASLQHKNWGVSLSYRSAFKTDLFREEGKKLRFLEIIADHYLELTLPQKQELELLKRHFILIPHAIHLSIGSASGPDPVYLRLLKKLIDYLNPPFWSEHLCYTHAFRNHVSIEIGHLTPFPFNARTLAVCLKNIETVYQTIPDYPLILENIAVMHVPPGGTMSEPEFFSQLTERISVGCLFDITNFYYNSLNCGLDATEYLSGFPADKVLLFHLAGGHIRDHFYIDSHSAPVPDSILDFSRSCFARFPKAWGCVIERDENLPPFTEIAEDLHKTRQIWQEFYPAKKN